MPNLPPLPPAVDLAAEFPISSHWLFLNHAGVAPLSARAAATLADYAHQAAHDAYLTGHWYRRCERTRTLAARLLNASADEVAFCKNTSEGLAFVANGLTWNPGDEIISTNVEYPANVYPWMDLAQRYAVKHIMVPERTDSPDAAGRIPSADLFAAITPKTRMIALSHVEYASGFRHDLHAIGQFCHDHHILLCIDGIQSAGAFPIDVQAMHIDFLAADGHKWLLAPEGAGLFFCRRDLLASLRPEVGWMNVVNAQDFDHYHFTLRPDARRFECGSWNIPGVLALGTALELLLEIGLDTISGRILALTAQLADGLTRKGYHVFSPRLTPAESSGILSFSSPTHDHATLLQSLAAQKIILALRASRLRASPHFYNTPEQIDRLLNALPPH